MFKSLSKKFFAFTYASNNSFSTAPQAGNLFTWGSGLGLGYKDKNKPEIPKQVPEFDRNVVHVSVGPSHTAVITTEGELWTFGSGNYGMLGHGDSKDREAPKRVDFFKEKNLKVIAVTCGENHTIALTDDGDVWSWGMARKDRNFLVNLFFPAFGSLGHGNNLNRSIPTPIEALRNLPPVVQISTGHNFATALNRDHDLYQWGRGEFAVFGDGNNTNLKVPTKNESITRMRTEDKITIQRIKSCYCYTMALFNDHTLWGWGSNESGQLGVKTEIGIELYETANFPTKVVEDKIKGKKVVDFDVGENISVFLTADTNEVYWAGLRLSYEPEQFKIPSDKKIVKVAASQKSIAALTGINLGNYISLVEDNQIYMKNDFLQRVDENLETGTRTANMTHFQGGKIIDIGGSYKNKYAIVQQSQSQSS